MTIYFKITEKGIATWVSKKILMQTF